MLPSSGLRMVPCHHAPAQSSSLSVESFQNSTHYAISQQTKLTHLAVLLSSDNCRVDSNFKHNLHLHSPVSSDTFESVQIRQDSSACEYPLRSAEGAVKRCEASVKRLGRMHEMVESLAEEAWSSSDISQSQKIELKLNEYYPTICSKLLDSRLPHQGSQPSNDDADSNAYPSLYENARRCAAGIRDEVCSLQMLEEQAVETVQAMLASMSGDVPIRSGEAHAIVSRVKASFNPARRALSEAVRTSAEETDSHARIARCSARRRALRDRHPTDTPRPVQQEEGRPPQPRRALHPRGLAPPALPPPMCALIPDSNRLAG